MALARRAHRSSNRVLDLSGFRDAPPPRLASQHFDPNSGQVFYETVIRVPVPAPATTFDRSPSHVRNNGPPSLEDIAVRSFLRNLDAVSSETLIGLHWDIGARLWKQVQNLDLARPSVWAAFAAAFPDEQQFRYYRASEITPQKTFAEYIDFLGSPGLEWLTCLTLSKIQLERADIMRLSDLSNLVAVDIFSSTDDHDIEHTSAITVMDDQVVRNWGRRAQESSSFPNLRVMILRNQRHVTARSLEYLSAFPQLVLFGVSGCSLSACDGETARRQGWTLDDERGIMPRINSDIDKSHTWDGALTACVKHSAAMLHSLHEPHSPDPPILSYRLGPTSSNVLYSVPLVFFRCFERKRPGELLMHDDTQVKDTTGGTQTAEPRAQARVSGVHLSKKRKIKVSAQRSFDSTLSDLLGGEVVCSSSQAPARPICDTSSIDVPIAGASQAPALSKSASTPATPDNALPKRRQARQDRDRPWRQPPDDKT